MNDDFGLSLFNLIGTGVVFYGLLVASLLLFSKSSHKIANRVLATIILIGVWYIIASILVLTNNFVHIASFFRIGLPSFYAVPPLILWYVKIRVDKSFRPKYIHLLHLLPVFLTVIDSIPFHMMESAEKQRLLSIISQDLRNIVTIRLGIIPDVLHFFLRPIQGLIYTTIAGAYLIKSLRDKKALKEIDQHKGLRTWLTLFIVLFAFIYLSLLATNFVWVALPYPLKDLMVISLIPSSLSVITFLAVHIFLFFNTNIIFGKPASKPKTYPDAEKILANENQTSIREIERLIIEKQIFKNPKITAPEIANMVGMPPHAFSATLNTKYGKRFPDFINTYRIEYVIAELNKGMSGSMSIEGIATEAGFASRSAFYNSFKKITGLTPSEYLKKQSKN